MPVSFSQNDLRVCPVCGGDISSELWMIIHRFERPKLWDRCCRGTIHQASCANGHQGVIRTPLLLYDPSAAMLIYSPAPGVNTYIQDQEYYSLLTRFDDRISPEEKERVQLPAQVVPRAQLSAALMTPQINASAIMPGTDRDESLMALYTSLQYCTPAQLQSRLQDVRLKPAETAGIRFELALQLGNLGDPDSLERAIDCLRKCLLFYDQAQYTYRWALIQSELASLYYRRRKGDQKENLLETVRCSELSLQVFNPNDFPEDYAIVHSNLANACLDATWNYPASIEKGVYSYEQALMIYTWSSYSKDRILVLGNYATAQIALGGTENLRGAVHSLEDVLAAGSLEKDIHGWAIAQINLGVACLRLSTSSRSEELTRAITYLRNACNTLNDRHQDRSYWVSANYNLGLALAARENMYSGLEAISLLETSRTFFLAGQADQKASDCTRTMAECVSRMLRSEQSTDKERFLLCQRAIDLFKSEEDSEQVGGLLLEMINITLKDTESSKDASIEAALKMARQGLRIFRRKDQLEYRGYGLMHLGIIYTQKTGLDQRGNTALSIKCFQTALTYLQKLEPSPQRYEAMSDLYGLILIAEKKLSS